ncbi:uncharacterized protein [Dermacentor andersoni]|uniref:uncharacterized protein n=1 Tax=Dermacentor andersoni TaxID=34620 RepID=UPI002155D257|nr:mucin-5AC-like [Dermacentor andersoni]
MKSVSLLLLAFRLVAMQAHYLAPRTFGFVHSHTAQLPGHHGYSMSVQAHGPSDHALPAHHGLHAGHAHPGHGHVVHQVQGPFSNAHQQQVDHAHQRNNHHHSAASHSLTAPIASNVNTVPVLMCRVVKVPVNATAPAAPPTHHSGSSSNQHVGSHIATSISHVFGKVVNPVVALLQNASVWLNRTAHRHQSATGIHPHQHTAAVPHSVFKKKLAVIGQLNHRTASTASVTARPSVPSDATTAPSRKTAVPSAVPAATTRSRPTTNMLTLAPVLVSTLGAPAPTLGVQHARADTFPNSPSTTSSADLPTSVTEEVPSKSIVTDHFARTTTTASESALARTVMSNRATLSTTTPAGAADSTTPDLGLLNLRANPFTIPAATISSVDLPASIPQEVSSTNRVSVATEAALSESTFPVTDTTTETTARATLSTSAFTSGLDLKTHALGSLDARADAFTALVTLTDVSPFGPAHGEQATSATATSTSTNGPTPLFPESTTRAVPTSVPEKSAASTFPVSLGAVSVRLAQFTSAPPSESTSRILPANEAPTVITAEDIVVATATDSTIRHPGMTLSQASLPASSQHERSTVIDARSVRPRAR